MCCGCSLVREKNGGGGGGGINVVIEIKCTEEGLSNVFVVEFVVEFVVFVEEFVAKYI